MTEPCNHEPMKIKWNDVAAPIIWFEDDKKEVIVEICRFCRCLYLSEIRSKKK